MDAGPGRGGLGAVGIGLAQTPTVDLGARAEP